MKLIDLLVKVENETLEDNARVIIENELYFYNANKKKFFTTPKGRNQGTYRNIFTNQLDLYCEILDNQELIEDKPKKIKKMAISDYKEVLNQYQLDVISHINLIIDRLDYLLEKR